MIKREKRKGFDVGEVCFLVKVFSFVIKYNYRIMFPLNVMGCWMMKKIVVRILWSLFESSPHRILCHVDWISISWQDVLPS